MSKNTNGNVIAFTLLLIHRLKCVQLCIFFQVFRFPNRKFYIIWKVVLAFSRLSHGVRSVE